ncbi:hypothetical protein M413DRAFT_168100 [Hebeloma cylindrosporum]|uniref:Uncharacterized protein n=1 Tax=Hebeloma cylindrosporum TaxID=76867 RepID=A0A0C3CB11_HEBCY|nr:hypothetical protein M413DRAFT_168100 [Hebeloma cylindrosporum h7]
MTGSFLPYKMTLSSRRRTPNYSTAFQTRDSRRKKLKWRRAMMNGKKKVQRPMPNKLDNNWTPVIFCYSAPGCKFPTQHYVGGLNVCTTGTNVSTATPGSALSSLNKPNFTLHT